MLMSGKCVLFWVIYLVLLCSRKCFLTSHWQSFFTPSGHNHSHAYINEGHINIGGIFSIHEPGSPRQCGNRLRDTGEVQYVEAMVYAINEINKKSDLLGNLQLGYVILDDCATADLALGQALHFMPLYPEALKSDCDKCNHTPSIRSSFYNVWGVLGAESTPSTIKISEVLNHFRIPVISPFATGDILSDKSKFPYFFRMVPPDHYQVQAIVALLEHFHWTYISVLHSKGEYGEGAKEMLRDLATDAGICIATSGVITTNKPLTKTLKKIVSLGSRVVVLFTDQEETRLIFEWVQKQNLTNYFVWVGSDGLGLNIDDLDGVERVADGSLSLTTVASLDHPFYTYFETEMTPFEDDNPWVRDMWSSLFHCSWDPEEINNSCNNHKGISQAEDYTRELAAVTVIDTVYIFAKALHNFINATCPQAFTDVEKLHQCSQNLSKFISFLKTVTIQGYSGDIRFDENGDVMGKYQVLNYHSFQNGSFLAKQVGVWDSATCELDIRDREVQWNNGSHEQPHSNCGVHCSSGEVYSYHKDTCCWDCLPCESNERVLNNHSKCEDCPPLTWPDQTTFTTCIALKPVITPWTNPVILVFVSMTSLGVIVCGMVFVAFMMHNNHRLIKATSRELSYIMLTGITLQYILPIFIVSTPGQLFCFCNYIGFNIGFTIVYAPLLTRTNRIYRIFRSGRRSLAKPSMTSPASQVLIVIGLIAIQVVMNVLTVLWTPPEVRLHMPKETEPLVEESCTFPFRGFIASLCFNLFLVLVCSFYAFKTRRLPDNFNESRYIALCVYTTLVIWTVFLPSYFVNNRAFHQVVLLCSATLLNGTVTLLCLYIPKIYATLRKDENVKFSYRTPSSNNHELNKYHQSNGSKSKSAMLHQSYSRPSLDGSTKRQSLSDSEDGSVPLKNSDISNTTNEYYHIK